MTTQIVKEDSRLVLRLSDLDQQKQDEQNLSLSEVRSRYVAFSNKTFLEIVATIDAWAVSTNAALDSATTLAEVRPIVQTAFADLAKFLGPLLAYEYIQKMKDYG